MANCGEGGSGGEAAASSNNTSSLFGSSTNTSSARPGSAFGFSPRSGSSCGVSSISGSGFFSPASALPAGVENAGKKGAEHETHDGSKDSKKEVSDAPKDSVNGSVKRSKEVSLTTKGLQKTNCIPNDFEIIFGDKKIECNRFQACFISDAIHRALSGDNTIDKFEVEDCECRSEVLEGISGLMKGFPIVINEENCYELERIFRVLDNNEILNSVVKFEIGDGKISASNCIFRLKIKKEHRLESEEELEYISSHLYKLDSQELSKLKEFGAETLEMIMSSEKLRLRDEDSLLELILSFGSEFANLYDYIEFQFLSLNGIDKFLSSIKLEEISCNVWESLCRRLRCDVNPNSSISHKRFKRDSFPFSSNREFNGIIDHLSKKCGGNVHEKGIVEITSSGEGTNKCWQVADYEWKDCWSSTASANSWICFDFKTRCVELERYVLRYRKSNGPGPCEIEGSNDGTNWKILESRMTKGPFGEARRFVGFGQSNVPDYEMSIYDCAKLGSNEFFRFIRLRQTGPNKSGNLQLNLCRIEFFGRLRFSESKVCESLNVKRKVL
jgi:hypothetical protein